MIVVVSYRIGSIVATVYLSFSQNIKEKPSLFIKHHVAPPFVDQATTTVVALTVGSITITWVPS